MASFFDLPTFFRRVSSTQLQRFFANYPAFDEFDWKTVKPRKIDSLLKRFALLPPEQREAAFQMFRRVDLLANPAGTQALIEASRWKPGDIPATLAIMRNAHDRALWTHMEHPDVIEHAHTLGRIDSLSKRMWATMHGLPASNLTGIDNITSELRRQIIGYLEPEQFRGKHCLVEHLQGEGGVECFFAYPSDYPAQRTGYDDAGNFQRNNWQPNFTIVFAFHSNRGALDIYSPGGAAVKNRLAQIFAYAAFERNEALRKPDSDCFDLGVLRSRDLTFPTHPADRISMVRIQSLRLQERESPGSGFEFHVNPRNRHERIQDKADTRLRNGYESLAEVMITSAVLQAFLMAPDGKERSILFRISAPSFCDLGDSPEEQTLRKYLQTWGIERHANYLATAA